MPNGNQHIIGKQLIEMQLPVGADGNSWNEKISVFSEKYLKPKLEILFDRYCSAEELIQIDKLAIDLGNLGNDMQDDELAELIANRLEEQLYSLIVLNNNFLKGEEIQIIKQPVQEEIFDQWLRYLENGILSWQAERLPEDELQQTILTSLASDTIAVNRLQTLLSVKSKSVDRLVSQYPDHFLQQLLEACTAKAQDFLIRFLKDLENLEKRWEYKAKPDRRANKYRTPFQPLRIRFLKEIITRYMTGQTNEINIQQAAEILINLFLTGENEYESEFIEQEIRSNKSAYPVLKDLPPDVVFNEIGKTGNKDVLSTAKGHLEQAPDEKEKTAAIRNKRGQKDWQDVKSDMEDAESITLKSDKKQKEDSTKKPKGGESIVRGVKDIRKEEISGFPENEPDRSRSKEIHGNSDMLKPKVGKAESQEQKQGIEPKKPQKDSIKQKQELNLNKEPQTDLTFRKGEQIIRDESQSAQTKKEKDFSSDQQPSKIIKESPYYNDDLSIADSIKDGESIYVHHAGIVLLHPFFTNLFRKLKLLDEEDFIDDNARQRAVHLIQYMATKETEIPEYEMVLARLLCGLPFEDPINRFINLSETELDEVESMMQAAIGHWGALGTASSDALREGFLQREGKLEKRQQDWHLVVERKSIDLLLDRLPFGWGLRTIKLPWMKNILHVTW